jgi:hypothetical protein
MVDCQELSGFAFSDPAAPAIRPRNLLEILHDR